MEMDEEKHSISLEDKSKNYNTVRSTENDENDYDPHEHRQVENPTTNFETLVHILKGSLGTGILAMPQAFYNAGYVNGIISTILMGILCTYGLHVLVRSQYILCKRHRVPILTYPISMKIALEEGPPFLRPLSSLAVVIVDGFLIVYQLGICVVYIVFVAENIKKVFDEHVAKLDVKIHICIIVIPLLLLYLIRNLKVLAPFSTVANILTFIGLGMLLHYIFKDIQPISSKRAFEDWNRYPLYFGTVLFALEAVGVVIALENNMKTPKSFGGYFGVLNIGMTVIVFLYALIGFLGYLCYGERAEGSVTLNLPSKEILAQAISIIFAIAIFISYALQGYVPVDIIWNNYLKKNFENSPYKLYLEYVVRLAVVLVTFLLAVAIPKLGLFISLFGALCLSVLGFAFPAMMEICVLWPDKLGRFNYQLYKDIFLIVFGCIGLVAGTYVSVRDIIIDFTRPDPETLKQAIDIAANLTDQM